MEKVPHLKNTSLKYLELESPDVNQVQLEEERTYAMKVIRLNPGITQTNFFCCIFHSMLIVFSFIIIGQLQPLIILDEEYYNVSQDEAGRVNTIIMIFQVIVRIAVMIPYGHYADKIGRKTMIRYGALNYLVSCILVPFQKSIFPGFIFAAILFSNGAAAVSSVPLLADYIADESKGKASGIVSMMIGLCAIIANLFVKLLLYKKFPLGTCYIVIGIMLFLALFLNSLGLKEGTYRAKNTNNLPEQPNPTSIIANFKEALTYYKTNGWLRISLIIQIIGSSDFHIFLTFMTLYVKSLFSSEVDSATANLTVNNIQTLVFLPSFFSNIIYGYFLDKPNKTINVSLFALTGGACSFIIMSLSTDPYDLKIRIAALLLGATIPGLFVITSFLNIKNFPPEKRGMMMGFSGLVGGIGYFIISAGGGIIYDKWRKDGPFLAGTALLVIAIIFVLRTYKSIRNEQVSPPEKNEEESVQE